MIRDLVMRGMGGSGPVDTSPKMLEIEFMKGTVTITIYSRVKQFDAGLSTRHGSLFTGNGVSR